jgi:penicillin-binding protein 1A
LQEIGVATLIDYAARFGFDPKSLPRNITLALGTQTATPLQMAAGYAVFANGGFKVDPYLITRIEDESGEVVFEVQPKIACAACEQPDGPDSNSVPVEQRAPRVISAQNAWLMSDIMHDAATVGTGRRTQELGRDDLAGKTGTTDDERDAWFNGFNSKLVASVWVGYDNERSLGEGEEGSSTAVPIWNHFMREALQGMPSSRMPRPDGLIEVRISPASGEPVDPLDPDGITEFFIMEQLPGSADSTDATATPGAVPVAPVKPATPSGEPLF